KNQGSGQSDLERGLRHSVGLLEFLIVSVADPIDTATNHRFDLQLDTLHKALGVDGYIPDQYYLPWGEPDNVHRTEPGVLIYRRNGDSGNMSLTKKERSRRTDVLVVYLVGETPTSGIHKGAFLTALQEI